MRAAGADDIIKIIYLWKIELARNSDVDHSAGAAVVVEKNEATDFGFVRVRYADIAFTSDYFYFATVRPLKTAVELSEDAAMVGWETQLASEGSVYSGVPKVVPPEDFGWIGSDQESRETDRVASGVEKAAAT